MAKIAVNGPDPEEAKAEKHVTEIMGSAQPLDGSKPKPVLVYEPSEESQTETTVPGAPETSVEQADSPHDDAALAETEPHTPLAADIEAVNEQLKAQTQNGPYEKDLDMEQLPEDFKSGDEPEDAATAAAVDDILHADGDAALSEAPRAKAIVMKPSVFERMKNGWFAWWGNPWKRYGTLVVAVLLIAAVLFVRPVHDIVLNTVGVRSSITATALDGATNLPLENVAITVDGTSAKTNEEGKVTLKGIKLGRHDVQVSKPAFKTVKKQAQYFGMRIVDLGEVTLKPAGLQLTYTFSDYLSGKPVANVAVASGEATTKSDKNGKAILTTVPGSTDKITLKKDGYRTETLDRPATGEAKLTQKLVPSARAIFVSKESGKYDVYKVYVDGKERKVLLEGTGLETQSIATLPSPAGDKVAVASTRDDKRNKDGYLLTALNIVDTESGEAVNLEYAEQITLLGWRGNTLVYLQTVAGASAANPSRQKIIAYDLTANKRFQLANANYFAGSELIANTLYYTVSATDPAATETFARVSVDGTGKKTLYSGNVWSLIRTDYNKMKLQTQDKWYEYTVGAATPVESTPVSDYRGQYFVDSPDAKISVRVDVRDSKGVFLVRNLADGKETELTTQKNMQAPLYWLNNSVVVYRVAGATEVADYAIHVDGGASKKISDVSLTGVR